MDKVKNISSIADCYGCGVCATACPKHIIHMRLNADGFYQPYIDEGEQCINCSLCLKVCSYIQENLSAPHEVRQSYASWSNENAVRRKSSSGGTGFEIARYLMQQGYEVLGVRYNAELNRAEHYIATTVEELIQSMGSKYLQSYTVDALKQFDGKKKYLVTGSPCQIDSIRRYIRHLKIEENFILTDFFCHGVPSQLVWNKYLAEVEKTTGKIVYASWRNKCSGWHDSWKAGIDGEDHGEKVDWHDSYNLLIRGSKNSYSSRYSQGDAFYRLFLSDCCLGKACYDRCKYKYRNSSADIRIGDLWGKKYKDNEDGVTGVVVFTEKGEAILKHINCSMTPEPFEIVAEGQMKAPAQRGRIYNRLWKLLRDENSSIYQLSTIVNNDLRRRRNVDRLRHPLRTCINIVKRIIKK